MIRKILVLLCCFILAACSAQTPKKDASLPVVQIQQKLNQNPLPLTGQQGVPVFNHILVIVLENKGYTHVVGNKDMPYFNQLAEQNTLLTNYFASTHPSLPNYLALIGGSTFGVTSDCSDCFLNEQSLPDLLDQKGISWKTYQEGMPSPCFIGNQDNYAQKHDPFIYFDPIRTDAARCQQHVVPYTQLQKDLSSGTLPDYSFITPNLCDSGHDCDAASVDSWLKSQMPSLVHSPVLASSSLIAITFDEADTSEMGSNPPVKHDGGHVATILISPQAKKGFQDDTPLNHYSLLKTILASWDLPKLNHTGDAETNLITAPWK